MKFENKTFSKSVDLDGNEFVECRFERCKLVYGGGKPPDIINCSFHEYQITFKDAAANTLSFITACYHGGFKKDIEATFHNIRSAPTGGGWTIH